MIKLNIKQLSKPGKQFVFELDEEDSILNIKENIEKEESQLITNIQQLYLDGEIQQNNTKLKQIDAIIKNKDKEISFILQENLKIRVLYENDCYIVECKPQTNILEFHKSIYQQTNLCVDQQKLMIDNEELLNFGTDLYETNNLKYLGFTHNMALQLVKQIDITVKWHKLLNEMVVIEKFQLKVPEKSKIRDLNEILLNKYGFMKTHQVLFDVKNDEIDFQEHQSLSSLNITQGSEIYLKYRIYVTIQFDKFKNQDGDTQVVIQFAPNQPFKYLKHTLLEKTNIPEQFQSLIFKGSVLNIEDSFEKIQFPHEECTITLKKEKLSLPIRYENANLKFKVYHDDDILSLKKEIANILKIEQIQEICIIYQQKEILQNEVKLNQTDYKQLQLFKINQIGNWIGEYQMGSLYQDQKIAIEQLNLMKEKYGNGVSMLLNIYNETGFSVKIKKEDFKIGGWFIRPQHEIPNNLYSTALFVHPKGQAYGVQGSIEFVNTENPNICYQFSWDIPWQKIIGGGNQFKCGQNVSYLTADNDKKSSPLINLTLKNSSDFYI